MTKSTDIQTKRLLITPFSERHLTPRYVGWLNNPEVVRFSEQRHRSHTLGSCREYWKSFDGTLNYFWAIEEIKSGLGHIGNINAYVDMNNQLADIGILIGEKDAWQKGYGFEAFLAVSHYLLNAIKLRKITAGTMATNTAMLKIMRRLGMMEETRRPKHFLWEGIQVDLVQMALCNSSWKEK
ncbi:GNAT family N-acetyltransferase [Chloroflexota bacterium]